MKSVNTREKDPVSPTQKPKSSPQVQMILSTVRKAALPILLITGAGITYNSCTKKDETVEVQPQVKLTYENGNWKFDVMEVKEETFQLGDGQKYFTHYIKEKLSRATGADLSYTKDLEGFTYAYIEITRRLNPELNLDNTDEIVGKKIKLPLKVSFTPREGKFFRSRLGYEYLRDAARADGMDISDPAKRKGIYEEASKFPIMPDSPYYECKDPDLDCKEQMSLNSQKTYEKFAKEFFERSAGVKLVYNDLMRDEAGEQAIVDQGKGGTELGSTHITGRSLDQSVKRFVINGEMVNIDNTSEENVNDIKTRLRPLLDKMLSEYFLRGEILVLDETHGNIPHYHLYLPEKIVPLKPQVVELDLSPSSIVKKPKIKETYEEGKLYTREKEGVKYYTFTVPNWKLTKMLDLLCTSSNEGMIEAVKKFNNTDYISPEDIIWIPVDFMKPELRDPALLLVENPDGISEDILQLYNSNNEESYYRVPKALLNQQ